MGSREREIAEVILLALQSYFQSGVPLGGGPYVFHSKDRGYRLVFKKLRESIWEASVEGQLWVLSRLEKDCHFLVFVGNHDQVRQFLKKN